MCTILLGDVLGICRRYCLLDNLDSIDLFDSIDLCGSIDFIDTIDLIDTKTDL